MSPEDSKLEEALEETFPASDPAANTVETGIRAGAPASEPAVIDNTAHSRFELQLNGHTAFLQYDRAPDALTLIHTEVPPELRGHHLGETLVRAALDSARSAGLRIVAVCPFVKTYLKRHPTIS